MVMKIAEAAAKGLRRLAEEMNESVDETVRTIIVTAAENIDEHFGDLTQEQANQISGALGGLSGSLIAVVDLRASRASLN